MLNTVFNTAQLFITIALVKEDCRRMDLLFDAHNIQRGDWEALCFAMARAHVPGFKMTKGRAGAPLRWDDYTRALLRLAVEETGLDVTAATKELATQEPWKSKVSHNRGAETLRDEFYRAEECWVSLARAAKAFDALPEDEKERARKLAGEY